LIRTATEADIPEIVRLGSQSLIDGPYAGMLKDTPEQSAKLAMEVIQKSNGKILLYQNDSGKVAGLIGFIVFPHYFTGELTATEIMWYILPEDRAGGNGIKLLWEAEKEAKAMGAKWMGCSAPDAQTASIYARFGYKTVETLCMKAL
jgi:N-acetylglutamate synthase-like GNAT family acetyltransferase